MGMPLPSLHSPSIASSNNASSSSSTSSTSPLQALIAQKDNLESELKALGSVLDSHKVTMHTTLTSFDGYPRADIDIAQIRTTRARIIHLRNDLKAVMDLTEKALHSHFAEMEVADAEEVQGSKAAITTTSPASTTTTTTATHTSTAATSTANADGTTTQAHTHSQPAFAVVNTVAPSSPAAEAGLKAGDRVVQFGDANWRNHEKLARVAQIVGRNEGRRVEVVVARDGGGKVEVLVLGVVPRRDWGGRGTLGCHLKEV